MSEVAENVFEGSAEVESQGGQNVEVEQKPKLEIPEVVVEAFVDGKEAGREEEKIWLAMLQAGAPFKSVKRFYDYLMVENGLAISKEDQNAIVANALVDLDISNEQDFDTAISNINTNISFINEKEATNILRAYARKNEIEYFKKPKGPQSVRSVFMKDFFDALYENPFMTQEDLNELIAKQNSTGITKSANAYHQFRELCNRIASKYTMQ